MKENNIIYDSFDNKIIIDNKNVNLYGFNLLYGTNGSGKTIMLKKISELINSPIFRMYNSIDKRDNIDNIKVFDYYYTALTGRNEIINYSNIDAIYYWLSVALTYGNLNDNIVLLDDMCWGGMDSEEKENIIYNLSEFSNTCPIITTSCHGDIKTLVKKRVINPNIIEL